MHTGDNYDSIEVSVVCLSRPCTQVKKYKCEKPKIVGKLAVRSNKGYRGHQVDHYYDGTCNIGHMVTSWLLSGSCREPAMKFPIIDGPQWLLWQWCRNEFESGGAPIHSKSGGTNPVLCAGRAPPLFGSKSTISPFGERFHDGQYSSVSLFFAVLLLTVPPCSAICKSGGTCPRPME